MQNWKLGFLGGGNMATALMQGVLTKGAMPPTAIRVSDPAPARQQALAALGVASAANNAAVIEWAEALVLAVKPQMVDAVLQAAASSFRTGQLLISVCAGVPLQRLAAHLPPGVRLVRAMPNTPALVGAGATALAFGADVSPEQARFVKNLFECVGLCVEVNEDAMNAVTGLSGSGPAYVFLIIEALIDAGVNQGLSPDVASTLAVQTVLGAAQLVQQTGEPPAVLRERVTSPGGTTLEGLAALEAAGLRDTFKQAVQRATQRARELGSGAKSANTIFGRDFPSE